jgi:hypothetical protein
MGEACMHEVDEKRVQMWVGKSEGRDRLEVPDIGPHGEDKIRMDQENALPPRKESPVPIR